MTTLAGVSAKIGDLSLFSSTTTSNATLAVSTVDWRTVDLGQITGRSFLAQPTTSTPVAYGTVVLAVAKSSIYMRLACRINSSSANAIYLISCYEGSTQHTSLVYTPSTGVLAAYRSSTSLAASAGNAMLPNVWNVIEVWFNIHDTTGRAQVKVNGAAACIDFTGDTRNAGTAGTIDNVRFGLVSGAPSSGCDMYFDDIGISDSAYLGLGAFTMLRPNADTATMNWTASTGNAWDCINDMSMTDFIYSDAAVTGTKALFELENLPASPSAVTTVILVARGRTSGAGGGSIQTTAQLSGTDVNGTAVAMDTTERNIIQIMDTKPGGGGWDETSVNNLKAGVITA